LNWETNGSHLITVGNGVTLTLRNITFTGITDNLAALISVVNGGHLILETSTSITGNNGSGGVYLQNNCAFSKTGGAIYGGTDTDYTPESDENTAHDGFGHAVYVSASTVPTPAVTRNATPPQGRMMICPTMSPVVPTSAGISHNRE
jgi:hypothetical protein